MNHQRSLAKIDASDWERVIEGDALSFEAVIDRHQAAVCAVAFNIVGDFSASQDIAQDTFWAAWSTKEKLREVSKLKSWLCGIARNLAKQWTRKKFNRKEVVADAAILSKAIDDTPLERFISDEEESLVWKALQGVPDNYRDVIELYYRQGRSIEEVAEQLKLSNDAARQRLHRGREMLKSHVSKLVEGVLDRNNPNQSFTARVMAGIVGSGFAGQAATAFAATANSSQSIASAVSVAKLLASGGGLGLLGGMVGIAGGMFGAWAGTWGPAQLAATETERQLMLERGRGIMWFTGWYSVAILLITLGLVCNWLSIIAFSILLPAMSVFYTVVIVVRTFKTNALVKQLRREISPWEDPNQSSIARRSYGTLKKQPTYRGRKYRSEASFLGLPLIDVQVASPPTPEDVEAARLNHEPVRMPEPSVARGWIAIGDVAYGRVLAIGGRAVGTVAVGGLAIGLVSIGGLALGLISIGGLAAGALTFGGLALGGCAWGGGAIAIWSAFGGGAIAYHCAMGGVAVAWEYAVGGVAVANETNTELARSVVEQFTPVDLFSNKWVYWIMAPIMGGLGALMNSLMYTRDDLLPLEEKFDEMIKDDS